MSTEAAKCCPKCNAPIPVEAPGGLCPQCVLAAVSIPTEAAQSAEGGAPPSLESIATGFPQLEILEFIGQGGMGLVFKARQKKLDRLVALKLLPQKPGANPAFCERFHREARVLARLSHPNIVAVHDFGESGPFFYLLMEYVDGVNLRQAMRAGRFTPAQALALVPRICDALQYAHEEGVLHRDIKPENLLLDSRGRIKIADFGIAKLVGEAKDITLTASGSAVGTPHYMAPEQLERPQDVDQRADVYSLGVVFYEMLTGELPIGRFAPPSEKAPIDPRVDEVVLRTLEKERERRYQSAGEVKTQVENITSTAAASQTGPSGTVRLPAKSEATGKESSGPARADSLRWSMRAIGGALLAGISLLIFALVLLNANHVTFGEFVLLSLLIGLPALSGTLLGWVVLRDFRASLTPRRGGRLALLSSIAWPLVLLDILFLSFPLMFVESVQWNANLQGTGLLPVAVAGSVLAILILDVLAVKHALKSWNSRRIMPHTDLITFLQRFPNRLVRFSIAAFALLLILLFIGHVRIRKMERPPLEPMVLAPGAPAGFEIPLGEAPGDERLYRSAVVVPPGYALTLVSVLSSNQMVLNPNAVTKSAILMAPRGQPIQGELTWRLLGNSTLADGAPLQFSLGLGGQESSEKVFHVATPEPVHVDWVAQPPRLWPPQNGHTKFLLVKGVSATPAPSDAPGVEWAVGIEARLDPIPDDVLHDLKNPVVTFSTNSVARREEVSAEAASASQSSENE